MAQTRDGSDKIVRLARALVILVTTFAGALKAKYPGTNPVSLLIDAIIALGALLPAAEAVMLDYGGSNEAVIVTPEDAKGIDPLAPAAPVFVEP